MISFIRLSCLLTVQLISSYPRVNATCPVNKYNTVTFLKRVGLEILRRVWDSKPHLRSTESGIILKIYLVHHNVRMPQSKQSVDVHTVITHDVNNNDFR
jgi:hypothetical protein